MDILKELIQLDHTLFLQINSLHTGFFDSFMHTYSKVAVWIPFYISVAWIIFRNYGRKGIIMILFLIAGVVLADQISVLLKNYFERPRPSRHPLLDGLVQLVNGRKGSKFGFVSSHAANTMGFALLSSLFIRNKIYSYAVFTWALITCYSRIYLGMHFPADIAGGAILGWIIAYSLFLLFQKTNKSISLLPVKNVLIPTITVGISTLIIIIFALF